MSNTYWHFAKIENGKPVMRDGTPIEIGKEYSVEKAELCESGYHGSKRIIDALHHAPGSWISKRIITDDVKKGDDKVCGKTCIHTVGIDATEVLRKFARMCALDVIHLWDAPEVVVKYLKTGNELLRDAASVSARAATRAATRVAARDAARVATWDAAWDAAWVAAWDAAWVDVSAAAAATKKQNERLTRMINKALKEDYTQWCVYI